MALFKKSLPPEIGADECEHILGILLSDRKQFINFSGIAQSNIYAGIVIGQAFTTDITKLDDEFDALAIFYAWKVLNEFNASEDQFMRGASAVFDNFNITKAMRTLYSRRIDQYSNLSTSDLGEALLNNIATIYRGKLEKNDPKILAHQLADFHKLLQVNIKRELAA